MPLSYFDDTAVAPVPVPFGVEEACYMEDVLLDFNTLNSNLIRKEEHLFTNQLENQSNYLHGNTRDHLAHPPTPEPKSGKTSPPETTWSKELILSALHAPGVIKQFLSQGTYGAIYKVIPAAHWIAAHSASLTTEQCLPFCIKIQFPLSTHRSNTGHEQWGCDLNNAHSGCNTEARFLSEFNPQMVREGRTPHLLTSYTIFRTNWQEVETFDERKLRHQIMVQRHAASLAQKETKQHNNKINKRQQSDDEIEENARATTDEPEYDAMSTVQVIVLPWAEYGSILTHMQRMTPEELHVVLFQVAFTLYALWRRAPAFRHNDLLFQNVLLYRRSSVAVYRITDEHVYVLPEVHIQARIADFDFAHICNDPQYQNDKLIMSAGTHGFADRANAFYDIFAFLYSLYNCLDDRLLPPGGNVTRSVTRAIRVFQNEPYSSKSMRLLGDSKRLPTDWFHAMESFNKFRVSAMQLQTCDQFNCAPLYSIDGLTMMSTYKSVTQDVIPSRTPPSTFTIETQSQNIEKQRELSSGEMCMVRGLLFRLCSHLGYWQSSTRPITMAERDRQHAALMIEFVHRYEIADVSELAKDIPNFTPILDHWVAAFLIRKILQRQSASSINATANQTATTDYSMTTVQLLARVKDFFPSKSRTRIFLTLYHAV